MVVKMVLRSAQTKASLMGSHSAHPRESYWESMMAEQMAELILRETNSVQTKALPIWKE